MGRGGLSAAWPGLFFGLIPIKVQRTRHCWVENRWHILASKTLLGSPLDLWKLRVEPSVLGVGGNVNSATMVLVPLRIRSKCILGSRGGIDQTPQGIHSET